MTLSVPQHLTPIRPVPNVLFPTMGSLREVLDLADSKLPITSRNELHGLLMAYHNTLIQEIQLER